ncbi:hypothetical protein BDN72DRAFT_839955 [Pluteus cervinus]|uniref:Uncharacterized protein n=1 Tax=Pluteus cervinus TaxID=181527 RepID=A0ACD3AVL9_9AGAR|nr:hypothetical protein BDN72DRAFT_839955 [Pluteus cervinus]
MLRICDGTTTDLASCATLGMKPKGKRELFFAFSSDTEKVAEMGLDLNSQIQPRHDRDHSVAPERDSQGNLNGTDFGGYFVDPKCSASLLWVEDILWDATREDIVTLCFHIWLFLLVVVTILNESLPHLFVGIAGHTLGTTWAGSRIVITRNLAVLYELAIVKGSCHGVDPLGSWWQARAMRAVPILVMNATAALTAIYFSIKLYEVYSVRTFGRVGSSPVAHSVYKLVLLFSVGVQLTAFFMICSTSTWLDKLLRGQTRWLATHLPLYIAAFALVALLIVPWHVFGWISVRRENRSYFLAFCIISVIFIVISGLMFASLIYRFTFETWPFFAALTVTSFMLLVSTSVLGLVCRCRFGSDFPQLLQAPEVPEGSDFTPVFVNLDALPDDVEKIGWAQVEVQKPAPIHTAPAKTYSSFFTDANRLTVKLTTTPVFLENSFDLSRLSALWTTKSQTDSSSITTTTIHGSTRRGKTPSSSGLHAPTSSAKPKPF